MSIDKPGFPHVSSPQLAPKFEPFEPDHFPKSDPDFGDPGGVQLPIFMGRKRPSHDDDQDAVFVERKRPSHDDDQDAVVPRREPVRDEPIHFIILDGDEDHDDGGEQDPVKL